MPAGLVLPVIAALLMAGACSDRQPPVADIDPVPADPADESPAAAERATTTTGPRREDGAWPDAAAEATRPTEGDEGRRIVDEVLARYDAALTTIAGDPIAATAEGHPALAAWSDAVRTDSSFSTAMLDDLRDRAEFDATVVLPGPDGVTHRHRALRAVRDRDSISFTWCGHSPGLGVDTTTGAVVDDAVAISHGSGELHLEGSRWRVVSLDALDVEVHGPGTADPCPLEATSEAPR